MIRPFILERTVTTTRLQNNTSSTQYTFYRNNSTCRTKIAVGWYIHEAKLESDGI